MEERGRGFLNTALSQNRQFVEKESFSLWRVMISKLQTDSWRGSDWKLTLEKYEGCF